MSCAAGIYQFEVRRISDGFAIALRSRAAGTRDDVYSSEKLSFSTGRSIKLRRISNDDWESAERLPYFGADMTAGPTGQALNPCSFGSCGPKDHSLHFSGKSFEGSGDRIESSPQGAILSPDGRWLVLQSGDWSPTNDSILTPDMGAFFLDLYEVSSGRKQFKVRTWHFGHNDPGSDTRWISSNLLFVDLFQTTKNFIICDATK